MAKEYRPPTPREHYKVLTHALHCVLFYSTRFNARDVQLTTSYLEEQKRAAWEALSEEDQVALTREEAGGGTRNAVEGGVIPPLRCGHPADALGVDNAGTEICTLCEDIPLPITPAPARFRVDGQVVTNRLPRRRR